MIRRAAFLVLGLLPAVAAAQAPGGVTGGGGRITSGGVVRAQAVVDSVFLDRKALDILNRGFTSPWRFIDIGRDHIERDTCRLQELRAPRRGRGEDEHLVIMVERRPRRFASAAAAPV